MPKSVISIAGSGGETLQAHIMSEMPTGYNVLHEPCGGTLTTSLNNPHKVRSAIDTNGYLVNVHNVVKTNPQGLIEVLGSLNDTYKPLPDMASKLDFYLDIRNRVNAASGTMLPTVEQAAHFICLTKLSFNSLLRLNKAGHFNVPFGKKEKACLCDTSTIMDVHAAMASLSIRQGSYVEVVDDAVANDFVLSAKTSWTKISAITS